MNILENEFKEIYGEKKFAFFRAILCYYRVLNFRVIVLIRIMQHTSNKVIKKAIQKKLKLKYVVDVGLETKIGKHFWVEHFNSLVIGKKAIIGKNCTLYQQITIGQKNNEYPIIGDNTIIYPGAKVIGGIKIGNNVTIGANAVVLQNVPDNCIAVGVPARIIHKKL